MTRFDVRVKPYTNFGYAWDKIRDDYMGDGNGGIITFDADDMVERDEVWGIVNLMEQRVNHPELTRADGKLVSV